MFPPPPLLLAKDGDRASATPRSFASNWQVLVLKLPVVLQIDISGLKGGGGRRRKKRQKNQTVGRRTNGAAAGEGADEYETGRP